VTDRIEQVLVPDLGGESSITVIEVLVKVGDTVSKDHSLITLEGDKATMDVPSPFAGKVKDIQIAVGDRVSAGTKILTLEIVAGEPTGAATSKATSTTKQTEKPNAQEQDKEAAESQLKEINEEKHRLPRALGESEFVHAGPAVRRIAREFDIDLTKLTGSGLKDRVTKEDIQTFVKQQLKIAAQKETTGMAIPAMPAIDFSKFGAIEQQPLSKIKKMTGVHLTRNWNTIPHVTQFAEADITELESFRNSQKEYAVKQNIKLTPLVFIMKALVSALQTFPAFNASLNSTAEYLILKKYFHIGVAVDTAAGLVVPVIRDVDKKGLFDLAKELSDISEKARANRLSITDMQGGCFSISSLGGIGGTAFTPIINAPEVAILGISRMQWKPIFDQSGNSTMRLLLPLSLSYDHRVIDGAEGARFIVYLAERLRDIRTLL